jgi:hypothetical protein
MASDNRYDRQEGTISMEDTFVKHFMYALDRLQTCWINDSGFNKEKFNLQLLYLVRLLPDKPQQNKILESWGKSQDEMKALIPGLSDGERQAYAGMEVVTELILFVCDAFELINTDITGPATSKQYKAAIIELPEMDAELPEIT